MKKGQSWIWAIIAFTILFIASSIFFKVFEIDILPSQFYGALIGVVITAIITVFLLRGQTANEEEREKSIKVFEKKQEIYHSFLEELKNIIRDGEISISGKDNNKSNNNVDELKDLIFQLGYLQMHTNQNNINRIFEGVANIIQLMNNLNSSNNRDNNLADFYAKLSDELFQIIALLKSDLYGKEETTISKTKVSEILRECGLFIDVVEYNKYEIQKFFWDELQKQLQKRGYSVDQKDFTKDINEYYARARNRHRWYGFNIIILNSKSTNRNIKFRVEIENAFYYGFSWENEPYTDDALNKIIDFVPGGFKHSQYWAGWKLSDNFHLDFWRMDSKGFNELKNKGLRESYISGIVDEMDMYIKRFVEVAVRENF